MKPAIVIFFMIELLVVSYLDFKYKKISNNWVILNLVLAILLYVFFKDIYVFDWKIFIYPFSFLIIGI